MNFHLNFSLSIILFQSSQRQQGFIHRMSRIEMEWQRERVSLSVIVDLYEFLDLIAAITFRQKSQREKKKSEKISNLDYGETSHKID